MERKGVIGLIITLAVLAFATVEIMMMRSLSKMGYGLSELAGTTGVFYRVSRGFSVGDSADGKMTVFIGRKNNDYGEFFESKGYKKIYELDGKIYYGESDKESDFAFCETDDTCTWYTVYEISKDHPIESFD